MTKIILSIKANDLPNVAGAFKGTSDPFAVLTVLASDREAKPFILGKTEVQKNTLDPDFVKTFPLDYDLGKPTNVLVKFFDKVTDGDNIPMGSAVFSIGSILGAKGNTKAKMLQDGGKVFIRARKQKDCGMLRLKLGGSDLTNLDGYFNKSDPFYQITKKDYGFRGSEWNIVHKSVFIKNNLNPEWDEEELDLDMLCDGDLDQVFKLELYDNESSGDHELMGGIKTSINALIENAGSSFDLVKDGETTGTLLVHVAEIIGGDYGTDEDPPEDDEEPEEEQTSERNSFTDYISGGCEINLCVAIDYTGSNGDPREPGTLHYLGEQKNDYEKAISSIGTILANYDNDKQFPVYGFGAKFDGEINHCFNCGDDETVSGVDGIIQAYRNTFQSGLVMSGPTVFTEVLQTAAAHAMSIQSEAFSEGKQKYTVLLILTDGAVSNVEETLECFESIKNAPLSVVIVGIGEGDFNTMNFFDDAGNENGGIDIAQFVEFNAHRDNWRSLTSATLDEIPKQLSSYFQRYGIKPNSPVEVDEEEIVVEPAGEEEIDLTLDFKGGDGDDGDNNDEGEIVIPSGGVYIPPHAY